MVSAGITFKHRCLTWYSESNIAYYIYVCMCNLWSPINTLHVYIAPSQKFNIRHNNLLELTMNINLPILRHLRAVNIKWCFWNVNLGTYLYPILLYIYKFLYYTTVTRLLLLHNPYIHLLLQTLHINVFFFRWCCWYAVSAKYFQ